jgi:hypothetical protein
MFFHDSTFLQTDLSDLPALYPVRPLPPLFSLQCTEKIDPPGIDITLCTGYVGPSALSHGPYLPTSHSSLKPLAPSPIICHISCCCVMQLSGGTADKEFSWPMSLHTDR